MLDGYRFDEDTARVYFQQLTAALTYCHAKGIVHRRLASSDGGFFPPEGPSPVSGPMSSQPMPGPHPYPQMFSIAPGPPGASQVMYHVPSQSSDLSSLAQSGYYSPPVPLDASPGQSFHSQHSSLSNLPHTTIPSSGPLLSASHSSMPATQPQPPPANSQHISHSSSIPSQHQTIPIQAQQPQLFPMWASATATPPPISTAEVCTGTRISTLGESSFILRCYCGSSAVTVEEKGNSSKVIETRTVLPCRTCKTWRLYGILTTLDF
eukprot:gene2888-2107_t